MSASHPTGSALLPETLDPHMSGVIEVVAAQAMEPSGYVQQAATATRVAAAARAFPPPDFDRSPSARGVAVALPAGAGAAVARW